MPRFSFISFRRLLSVALALAVSPSVLKADTASDVEILCAYQERFIACFGVPYAFPLLSDGTRPVFPKPDDYSAIQSRSIIENGVLERLKSDSYGSYLPLVYIDQDIPLGLRTWGEVKALRTKFPKPPTWGDPYELTRSEIVKLLRKMKQAAVPVSIEGCERRRIWANTPLYGPGPPPGEASNMPQTAQLYNDAPWQIQPVDRYLHWGFMAWNAPYFWRAESAVDKARLYPPAHLTGSPSRIFLLMDPLTGNWPDTDPDFIRVMEYLSGKNFYPNGTYFEVSGGVFDPGNLFAVCQNSIDVYTGTWFEYRNVNSDRNAFALVTPTFTYLPSDTDCSACSTHGCPVGSATPRLDSGVSIGIDFGRGRQGQASASLKIDSPTVTSQLFTLASLQSRQWHQPEHRAFPPLPPSGNPRHHHQI